MKNLLRFEFYNVLRQKIIYITMAVMLILLTLQNNTPSDRLSYLLEIGYGSEDMVVGALSDCFFTSFLAVMVSFAVCRDYEQNVLKNVYAKGYLRTRVFSAKFLTAMLLTAAAYIITVLLGLAEAVMVFGTMPRGIGMIMLAQFAAVLAYTAFDVLFCVLFKKTGFAVAFLIIVPPVGGLLLDMLDGALGFGFSFADLWITQTMSYIHGGTVTNTELAMSFVMSAAYIAVCFAAGSLISKKTD